MPPLGRYHIKIADLMNIERDLLLAMVDDPDLLHPRQEALVRWTLGLGRMCLLRTPGGYDIDVSEPLTPFREWLIDRLGAVFTPDGKVNGSALRSLLPSMAHRLEAARQLVLDHFAGDIGAEHLDEEIRHRELVLVLGGGGGSGFVHLATFAVMDQLGLTPELIVGSSMGSLLGFFRAMARDYSPEEALEVVPRSFDLAEIFKPFTGATRFGFPGAFHMQLLRPAAEALQQLTGQAHLPTFDDLPIRLEVIVTGVRTGFAHHSDIEEQLKQQDSSFTPFALRRKLKLFFGAVKDLSDNPRLLRQLVFGREEGTEDFNVVEAVGFSCSVPGMLHYDVFHDDPETVGVLEDIFAKHRLWRMIDGGVVNNVGSRVAWESVMQGNIGTRNAFIFAGDAFAPTGSNFLFSPVQQIARPAVLSNRPFSDFHKTFKSPPSPLNLRPSYRKLRRIIKRATKELKGDAAYLRRAMTSLPPYGVWNQVV